MHSILRFSGFFDWVIYEKYLFLPNASNSVLLMVPVSSDGAQMLLKDAFVIQIEGRHYPYQIRKRIYEETDNATFTGRVVSRVSYYFVGVSKQSGYPRSCPFCPVFSFLLIMKYASYSFE